jgi:hypothetical protein
MEVQIEPFESLCLEPILIFVILPSSSNLVGLEELEFEWQWCSQVPLCRIATFYLFIHFLYYLLYL